MATPIQIPQTSSGMVIQVFSGGFVMTGYTAQLLMRINTDNAGPVILPLFLAMDGLSGTYTTTGHEFDASGPGLYNAQLKIFNGSGALLYSMQALGQIYVQGPVLA